MDEPEDRPPWVRQALPFLAPAGTILYHIQMTATLLFIVFFPLALLDLLGALPGFLHPAMRLINPDWQPEPFNYLRYLLAQFSD